MISRVETAASKRIKLLVREEELKIKLKKKKEARAERHRLRELEKQASLTDEKKAKLAHLQQLKTMSPEERKKYERKQKQMHQKMK